MGGATGMIGVQWALSGLGISLVVEALGLIGIPRFVMAEQQVCRIGILP